MDKVDKSVAVYDRLWLAEASMPQNTSGKWRPHGDSNPGYRRERANLTVVLFGVFIALVPFCGQANTFFEIGTAYKGKPLTIDLEVGQSYYNKAGDNVWYQRPFPASLDLRNTAYAVALRAPVRSWLDARVGFINLGRIQTDALAVPDDNAYNIATHQVIDHTMPPSRFLSRANARGVFLTLQPTLRIGDFFAFAEGGTMLAHVKSDVVVIHDPGYTSPEFPNGLPPGTPLEYQCDPCRVNDFGFVPRVGLGIGYRSVALSYSYFGDLKFHGEDRSNGIPIFTSAHLLTLRSSF